MFCSTPYCNNRVPFASLYGPILWVRWHCFTVGSCVNVLQQTESILSSSWGCYSTSEPKVSLYWLVAWARFVVWRRRKMMSFWPINYSNCILRLCGKGTNRERAYRQKASQTRCYLDSRDGLSLRLGRSQVHAGTRVVLPTEMVGVNHNVYRQSILG